LDPLLFSLAPYFIEVAVAGVFVVEATGLGWAVLFFFMTLAVVVTLTATVSIAESPGTTPWAPDSGNLMLLLVPLGDMVLLAVLYA